jgi:hypothetical protein
MLRSFGAVHLLIEEILVLSSRARLPTRSFIYLGVADRVRGTRLSCSDLMRENVLPSGGLENRRPFGGLAGLPAKQARWLAPWKSGQGLKR